MQALQTLRAIELAFRLLQESLVDENGILALDEAFIEGFDDLMEKFHQT